MHGTILSGHISLVSLIPGNILMLKFGIGIKDAKEVLGQLPRLLVGGVKSFVGKIPLGNTGGANIPPLQPMPVPQDIQELFR